MKKLVAALVAAAALTGVAQSADASVLSPTRLVATPTGTSHQGHIARSAYASDIGAQWGTFADTQIQRALGHDAGDGRPYADSSLAFAITQRSALGWDDPAAQHYYDATMSQPNPYGLNYAWDAFQDGTVNPASTIYTITLVQVGDVVLDAYKHGHAPYTAVTDIMRYIVNTPRIAVTPGMSLAYSNNANDVKAGYAVHNINQAVAMFLRDCQQAGILWSDAQIKSWITKLNQYETASYKPSLLGWPYRNGGSQALQDVGHNGVGALWGMIFNPSSIGYPVLNHQMRTNYGYVQGAGMHATLAYRDCVDSKLWYPEWGQVEADPSFDTFDVTSRLSRPTAYTSTQCAGQAKATPKRSHFTVQKVKPQLRSQTKHVAPDAM